MFEYFKDNYAWNLTALTLIEEVGTISQPAEAFAQAAKFADASPAVANAAWYDAMVALGENAERLAEADVTEQHRLTAARKFHRAAMYFIRAERIVPHTDHRKLTAYKRALVNYKKARDFGQDGVEFVNIPYEAGQIPGLLVAATTDGKPSPLVVHIQGYDSLKETQWPTLQEYRRRGLSVLIVDQPGAGEALRLYDLHARYDSEAYVRHIVDWIMSRPDLATDRIGLCGMSMGGYFAPRAAAFEPRIRAVASWGAMHDAGAIARTAFEGKKSEVESVPDAMLHGLWTFGVDSVPAFAAIVQKMTLTGVVDKISVPMLIVHGENDRQVPLEQAVMTYDQAKTTDKTLKVFRQDEGGVEHCQIDNRFIAADYLSDWFSEKL